MFFLLILKVPRVKEREKVSIDKDTPIINNDTKEDNNYHLFNIIRFNNIY